MLRFVVATVAGLGRAVRRRLAGGAARPRLVRGAGLDLGRVRGLDLRRVSGLSLALRRQLGLSRRGGLLLGGEQLRPAGGFGLQLGGVGRLGLLQLLLT